MSQNQYNQIFIAAANFCDGAWDVLRDNPTINAQVSEALSENDFVSLAHAQLEEETRRAIDEVTKKSGLMVLREANILSATFSKVGVKTLPQLLAKAGFTADDQTALKKNACFDLADCCAQLV